MSPSVTSLLLLAALPGLMVDATLTESGGGLQTPGGTLTLVCQASGFTFSSYNMFWVRQAPGEGPEWLACINTAGTSKYYGSAVEGRATMSRDNDQSTLTLQLNSLTTDDTATYYCAKSFNGKNCGAGWIDAWGTGTEVVVSSGSTSPSPPLLFPLVPCSPSASLYTVGCAAFDFQPSSISFSWTDASNQSVAALNFGSLFSPSRRFRASSRIQMTQTEGKERQPFRCRAVHPRGNAEVVLENPGSPSTPTPLLLTIHPPSRDDFEGPFRNASILCQTRGRRRPGAVTWYKNGVSIPGSVVTVVKAGAETVAESRVGVTESEWDSGVTFSCLVEGEMRNTSKRMECGLETPDPAEITVRVVPPSFVDIFTSKSAKLTCRVSNMGNVESLDVSWWKETGGKLETAVGQRVLQSNGLYAVEAVASVCADEWERGEDYICKVNHHELLFPVEERLRKTEARNARPPKVYVFPPPPEQLNDRQSLSITCLAQGFNPPQFFIRWLRNGEPLPQSHSLTSSPMAERPENESYVAYSVLRVGAEEWGAGNVYTCVVGHEALELQLVQKSVDKASGKAGAVNVSLVLADSASACY